MKDISLDNFGLSKLSNESAYYQYMTYGNLGNLTMKNTSRDNGNITTTVNKENGTVTINGTYTASAELVEYPLSYGQYMQFPFDVKLTGAPDDAADGKYYYGGSGITKQTSNYIIPANTRFKVAIVVRKNVICDNVVFTPRLTPLCNADDLYSPYVSSNRELAQNILDIYKDYLPFRTFKFTPEIYGEIITIKGGNNVLDDPYTTSWTNYTIFAVNSIYNDNPTNPRFRIYAEDNTYDGSKCLSCLIFGRRYLYHLYVRFATTNHTLAEYNLTKIYAAVDDDLTLTVDPENNKYVDVNVTVNHATQILFLGVCYRPICITKLKD